MDAGVEGGCMYGWCDEVITRCSILGMTLCGLMHRSIFI